MTIPRRKLSIHQRRKVAQALAKIVDAFDGQLDSPVLADVLQRNASNAYLGQVVLSARDAAKYLGLAPKTLAMWRWKGVGGPPFLKHGSKVVYRRSDLAAFLHDAERTSTSHNPA